MTTYEVKERLREYRKACRRCGELEQRIARKRSDMRALRAPSEPIHSQAAKGIPWRPLSRG